MAEYDFPTAISLLGKTALVELKWTGDPAPVWVCVHIIGVVLAVEGIYEHPHFMTLDAFEPQPFPNEMFWTNIRSLQALGPAKCNDPGARMGACGTRQPSSLRPRAGQGEVE